MLNITYHKPAQIKSSIPAELKRRLNDIQYSSRAGPPEDLSDHKKRWLVVGICLHSILSPPLRKYANYVVINLYNSLKLSDQIDVQTQSGYLRTYGASNIYLNYAPIYNNKTTHGNRTVLYDYKVRNGIDMSKMFLQTHMTNYTAFDESCDSSALLGMIVNIDKFPVNVQTAAKDVKIVRSYILGLIVILTSEIQQSTTCHYKNGDFISLLHLSGHEKSENIGQLNKWRTNEGSQYCNMSFYTNYSNKPFLCNFYEKICCESVYE